MSLNIRADEYSMAPMQTSARLEKDILNGKLAENSEKALDAVINVAANELIKAGYVLEGKSFQSDWYSTYRRDFHNFVFGISNYDIGDHRPLNQWLADEYEKIEILLGVSVCKSMHLSDIKTINYAVPVVFKPCNFPMDSITIDRKSEYRNHFSRGDVYFGLAPVVSYWVTYIAVTGATMGTGYVFIAGLAGELAENIFVLITPKLSDAVFTKACGGI